MTLGIGEIMQAASAIKNHRDRINFIRKYDSYPLRKIIWLAYGDVTWDLPEGWRPEYTPSIFVDLQSNLHSATKRLDKFLVGGYPGLTQEKKQLLFVQLLESIDPLDAKIMLGVIRGKLPKNLGKKFISEAFPDLPIKLDPPRENKIEDVTMKTTIKIEPYLYPKLFDAMTSVAIAQGWENPPEEYNLMVHPDVCVRCIDSFFGRLTEQETQRFLFDDPGDLMCRKGAYEADAFIDAWDNGELDPTDA